MDPASVQSSPERDDKNPVAFVYPLPSAVAEPLLLKRSIRNMRAAKNVRQVL